MQRVRVPQRHHVVRDLPHRGEQVPPVALDDGEHVGLVDVPEHGDGHADRVEQPLHGRLLLLEAGKVVVHDLLQELLESILHHGIPVPVEDAAFELVHLPVREEEGRPVPLGPEPVEEIVVGTP